MLIGRLVSQAGNRLTASLRLRNAGAGNQFLAKVKREVGGRQVERKECAPIKHFLRIDYCGLRLIW